MVSSFKDNVCVLVASIPRGRVMTYGQIAGLCGHPGAGRVVGQIAHFGPAHIPWQRVVNTKGGLASGFSYGGRDEQARMLINEGVLVEDGHLDLDKYIWWPKR